MINRPRPTSLFLLLLLVVIAQPAMADGSAARGPSVPNGDTESGMISGGGLLELNPTRAVVNATAGFDSVTSVRVDTDLGTVGGYAEFDLNQDLTVPVSTTIGSISQGSLILDAVVDIEDGGPTASGDMVVEFEFDGAFNVIDQMPSLVLTADVIVTQLIGFPPSGSIYQSLLTYSLSRATPVYEVVTSELGVQAPLFGGSSVPYAGATNEVINIDPNSLAGVVRLTIPVEAGDQVIITCLLNGIATAEPSSIPPGDNVTVLTSAGTVDFSNTGILSVTMPAGLTLAGDDPLIPNVVPEPTMANLLIVGTTSLLGVARLRRRQKSRDSVFVS